MTALKDHTRVRVVVSDPWEFPEWNGSLDFFATVLESDGSGLLIQTDNEISIPPFRSTHVLAERRRADVEVSPNALRAGLSCSCILVPPERAGSLADARAFPYRGRSGLIATITAAGI